MPSAGEGGSCAPSRDVSISGSDGTLPSSAERSIHRCGERLAFGTKEHRNFRNSFGLSPSQDARLPRLTKETYQ
jgi:hypothetical protein